MIWNVHCLFVGGDMRSGAVARCLALVQTLLLLKPVTVTTAICNYTCDNKVYAQLQHRVLHSGSSVQTCCDLCAKDMQCEAWNWAFDQKMCGLYRKMIDRTDILTTANGCFGEAPLRPKQPDEATTTTAKKDWINQNLIVIVFIASGVFLVIVLVGAVVYYKTRKKKMKKKRRLRTDPSTSREAADAVSLQGQSQVPSTGLSTFFKEPETATVAVANPKPSPDSGSGSMDPVDQSSKKKKTRKKEKKGIEDSSLRSAHSSTEGKDEAANSMVTATF